MNNNNNVLVSVVMCTYNGSAYIDDQVNSIRRQAHQNLEIIIADDSSTDDTFQKLQAHASVDPRIRLYRNEKNLGYNINFSRACGHTSGEYIAIADQDDIWAEHKIGVMLKKIRENESTLMVHCISARFEEFGKFHLKSHRLINQDAGNDVRNFFLANYISGHNMLLRKTLLDKALPFPSEVYYDWWLAAVASCYGRIAAVPGILVWHRMHSSNATGAAKPRILLWHQVMTILPILLNIKEMKPAHREFGHRLASLYASLGRRKFSWPLFRFILRHGPVLFAHKKRIFPWISYLKHAYRSAKASTPA